VSASALRRLADEVDSKRGLVIELTSDAAYDLAGVFSIILSSRDQCYDFENILKIYLYKKLVIVTHITAI
jgi:hypothetical protein